MSTRAPQFYDFLHFKGCSYLNCKISFNLSVEVAIFLVFHNPFMMLFHILMSVSDHELMLDNFLLRSSVTERPFLIVTLFFYYSSTIAGCDQERCASCPDNKCTECQEGFGLFEDECFPSNCKVYPLPR